jgi:hypothetical protein
MAIRSLAQQRYLAMLAHKSDKVSKQPKTIEAFTPNTSSTEPYSNLPKTPYASTKVSPITADKPQREAPLHIDVPKTSSSSMSFPKLKKLFKKTY